jgi:2'-hydroxyisoflavone reductase
LKNVLIIGGTNFAGRVLVEDLLKDGGYKIFIMSRGNLPAEWEEVVPIQCDRHEIEELKRSLPDVSWNVIIDFCAYNPQDIASFVSVLQPKSLGHYIFLSTTCVYENTHVLPVHEDAPKVNGEYPPGVQGNYAYNKYLAELKLIHWCRDKDVPWTIFRPTFVYGKYIYGAHESFFFEHLIERKTIILPDSNLPLYTFVSVWDVAKAVQHSIGNEKTFDRPFNLAGEELISYPRILDVLKTVTGRNLQVKLLGADEIGRKKIPVPFPIDKHFVYSGKLITSLIPMKYIPYLDGMRMAYEWYTDHRKENFSSLPG